MKRTLFVFLFLSLFSRPSKAQLYSQHTIDSLLQLKSGEQDDSAKMNTLIELARNYPYINPNEGLKCGKEALEIAQRLDIEIKKANAYSAMGENYATKSEYVAALECDYKALHIYDKENDPRTRAAQMRNIGIVLHYSNDQKAALDYDNRALALFLQLGLKTEIAKLYNNISNVYYTLRDTENILKYDLKALDLFTEMNDPQGQARLIGNIANFYAEFGQYNIAMVNYFEALRRERALKNDDGVTRNLGNIGETYLDIYKDTSGSIKPDSLIPTDKKAILAKALQFLQLCFNNIRITGEMEYFQAFGETLSEAYELSGDDKTALALYREYIDVRDSIVDVEKYDEATRKRLDYEYGNREDSLRYQKDLSDVKLADEQTARGREQIFYITGITLVLIFSVFMFNRWKVTQRQKMIIDAERKRSDELLLNILPAETAKELKEKGQSDARTIKSATVLFTDFKGFTQIAEKFTPEELVAEINECFSAFDRIMEKNGIEKIKTIGDSYMAAGGLPVENSTHASDMVHAALEISEFMRNWEKNKKAAGLPYFEIRIGIHTGPVVAGVVGTKKFQYDIWGDTVNTASRMESSGETGKVNISSATYALVKDKFICTYRGKVQAKNKGEVDMYFVALN